MYRTTDFYLACYLMHRGETLLSVDPMSPSRVVFIFERMEERHVLDYYNRVPLNQTSSDADSSFLGIVDAIRHTRELLYNALENANKA